MKFYLLILLLVNYFNSYNQTLNNLDFNIIVFDTKEIVSHLKQNKVDFVLNALNISNLETKNKLSKVLSDKNYDFNNASLTKTYIFPSYRLTNKINEFELTIEAFKIIKDETNPKRERAIFHFIIKSKINYNKNDLKVSFEKSNILFNENEIKIWWLGQWKDYVSETSKIKKQFGYLPPPPSPPPTNVK